MPRFQSDGFDEYCIYLVILNDLVDELIIVIYEHPLQIHIFLSIYDGSIEILVSFICHFSIDSIGSG